MPQKNDADKRPFKFQRFLLVTLRGGQMVRIPHSDIEKMYAEFKLPFPLINKAVLSAAFRKAINEYGITLTNVDTDSMGIQETFIPPHEIKSIVLIIAPEDMSEGDIHEKRRKGNYANL